MRIMSVRSERLPGWDAELSLIVNAAFACAPRNAALGQTALPQERVPASTSPPNTHRSRDHPTIQSRRSWNSLRPGRGRINPN
jgi:hypothetical protein